MSGAQASFRGMLEEVKGLFASDTQKSESSQDKASPSPSAETEQSDTVMGQIIDEASRLRPQLNVIGYDFSVLRMHLTLLPKVTLMLQKLHGADLSVIEIVLEDTSLTTIQKAILSSIFRVEKLATGLEGKGYKVASIAVTVGIACIPEVSIDIVPADALLRAYPGGGASVGAITLDVDMKKGSQHETASTSSPQTTENIGMTPSPSAEVAPTRTYMSNSRFVDI